MASAVTSDQCVLDITQIMGKVDSIVGKMLIHFYPAPEPVVTNEGNEF